MRRGRVVAAVAAVLAVTAGTIAVTQLGGAEEPAGSRNTGLPPATAPVERGDLRDSAQPRPTGPSATTSSARSTPARRAP